MNKLQAAKRVAGAGFAIALALTAAWEGLRTKAYLDIVDVPTICYGSTKGVRIGDTATKAECELLLSQELTEYWYAVDEAIKVDISQNEQAAYASWAYNVGINAMRTSTLVRKVNAGDRRGGCAELLKWNKAGGKPVKGLAARRKAEYDICIGGLDQ